MNKKGLESLKVCTRIHFFVFQWRCTITDFIIRGRHFRWKKNIILPSIYLGIFLAGQLEAGLPKELIPLHLFGLCHLLSRFLVQAFEPVGRGGRLSGGHNLRRLWLSGGHNLWGFTPSTFMIGLNDHRLFAVRARREQVTELSNKSDFKKKESVLKSVLCTVFMRIRTQPTGSMVRLKKN